MKPVAVVVSLPVTDVERSSRFYRDGLGLETSDVEEGAVAFELPNLSLFLIEHSQYKTYTDRAGIRADDLPVAGACVISCAMSSKGELDDVLARAKAAGGSVPRPADDHDEGYMGYFSDPDGHLWELVFSTRTEAAGAS
ncbi:VOC family protein [Kibdelosporangium persicum]|uniref:Glyoxalase bleomycin resistance protein dioxygenase n=1 Tax=Kibdelosporangium persicum TaxID=2698649 RepID=A0ABX2F7U7_9PSEU|nr:VOC family protein [Kibdelosporangium persicum]NRN66991.1 Glyoxalase bleomycin resistance protein dioxygenase [Kibdelosporangium persicum]